MPVTGGASQPEGAGEGARHFLGADVFLGGICWPHKISGHRFGSARTLLKRQTRVKHPAKFVITGLDPVISFKKKRCAGRARA
jgi:hypothetical protein